VRGLGLTAAVFLVLAAPAWSGALPALRDGDVAFHTSRSAQSVAIQSATHSPYSHMGMVVFRGGKPFVLEAISTVRETPLREWLARGAGGHYVVKRLRDADTVLDAEAARRLVAAASSFVGRAYDLTFEWSDDRVYCSELVWKAYHEALGIDLGELTELRAFDLTDPRVRSRMRERYGDRVPLGEKVISPAAVFASPRLVVVAEE
jgi:hypothetical protein